jgi:hypothetical protein
LAPTCAVFSRLRAAARALSPSNGPGALAGDESGRNGRDLRTAARCVRARQAQMVKAVFENKSQILRIEHQLQLTRLVQVSLRSIR